jgi:histidinol phosphatase-like PHP family hydrolase
MPQAPFVPPPLPQDLHIHTVFSKGDSSVVPEQTVALIAQVAHARILGISDHMDGIADNFPAYEKEVRRYGLRLGTELDGAQWLAAALDLPVEYFIYHCRDRAEEYRGAERLLATGKPVIIAHPAVLSTDLSKVPPECLVEVNNRYSWRDDWRKSLGPWVSRFRFVISSDAHQPNWLNQTYARYVAAALGIRETLLFP